MTNHEATDTISRQATIKAIQNHFNPTGAELSPDLASVLAGVGVVINTMPPLPSRPQGHWTNISVSVSGDSTAECNRCGAIVHNSFADTINFCPNCGADMRP